MLHYAKCQEISLVILGKQIFILFTSYIFCEVQDESIFVFEIIAMSEVRERESGRLGRGMEDKQRVSFNVYIHREQTYVYTLVGHVGQNLAQTYDSPS